MEDESVRIRELNGIPSAEEFASEIETRNVPVVFHGCIKDWKAFSRWKPSNGGLDYLQELAGSSTVEAMLSKSAPVFYGDIRSHERVLVPFSTFIGYCKDLYQESSEDHALSSNSVKLVPARSEMEHDNMQIGDVSRQVYLAQVPIMNLEKEERVQLESLREDIQIPLFLETKTMGSINFWMNGPQTRSSTHYDPHHNLLCVVAGSKQVDLWPPSASPFLYPMPLYGEASNHSAVAIDRPDLSLHPRAEHSKRYSQRVILHAGDALFLPEGWFHQVDSESLTVAVNFWWRSEIMSRMSEHMDPYYLRIILKRLVDNEMNQMLHKTLPFVCEKPNHEQSDDSCCNVSGDNIKVLGGNKLHDGIMLHDLEPSALRSLHELVGLVHDRVNAADLSPALGSTSDVRELKKIVRLDLYHLEDDPVASIIWALKPLILQELFLAMAHHFPRTLEALILHLLSPVGAEVLTRKFEEMDRLTSEEERNEFYRIFYGVFDDQFAVMDALLNGKESFASQAFKNVLDRYLGVKV